MINFIQKASYDRALKLASANFTSDTKIPDWTTEKGWEAEIGMDLASLALHPGLVWDHNREKAIHFSKRVVFATNINKTNGVAHIILPAFVSDPFTDDRRIDYDEIENAVWYAHRAMERIYTTKKDDSWVRRKVGITGLADMLLMLNIRYDSMEGLEVCREVCYHVARASWMASIVHHGENLSFDTHSYIRSDKLDRFLNQAGRRLDNVIMKQMRTSSKFRYFDGTTADSPPANACEIANFVSSGVGVLQPTRAWWKDSNDRSDTEFGYSFMEFVRWFYEIESGVSISRDNPPEFLDRCWAIDHNVYNTCCKGISEPNVCMKYTWVYEIIALDLL